MEQYKQEFIEFMVDSKVLRFGDFVTKSGRKTPFFINAGLYMTGMQLDKLGEYYAKAIYQRFGTDFDILFGPAYKGIPLSVATTIALHRLYGAQVSYCANRKEEKDHGETGILLGASIQKQSRIVFIEDVTTSGKSIDETMPIIKAQGGEQVLGLVISVDRMERGKGSKSALAEVKEQYGMDAVAIVTMKEVIEHLHNRPYHGVVYIDDAMKQAIDDYYEQYGAKEE